MAHLTSTKVSDETYTNVHIKEQKVSQYSRLVPTQVVESVAAVLQISIILSILDIVEH